MLEEKRVALRSSSGKTLIVYARITGNVLEDVVFSGDFFAYPEDSIMVLEEKLRGLSLGEALKTIDEVLRDTVLLGVSIDDLKEGVKKIFEQAQNTLEDKDTRR